MSMSFKVFTRGFLVGLPALLLVSCVTSTSLVNVWEDPAYKGGPFKKIIVFGLAADGGMSRAFEDIFAAELTQHGVEGIPGHTVVPEGEQADREAIEKAARAAGADGFLLARLVKTAKESQNAPGYTPAVPPDLSTMPGGIGYYNNNFYGYYGAAYIYSPPASYQYEVVTVETNLWDVRTEKLVWSGTTQTFAPGSVSREAPGFAKLIVNTLAARDLVPVKK